MSANDTKPSSLHDELRQTRPFASVEEEAFLALQRTAGLLQNGLARALRTCGLTPTQYNVLRIVRGAGRRGLSCGEIGARMVRPGPDVTRVVDRLTDRGLVRRHRGDDRRVVRVALRTAGATALDDLAAPVARYLAVSMAPLADDDLRRLIGLLGKLRTPS